ncbi:flagellar basal body-associated protein FliL [Idiomarina loihiensis]|jgi:flagellar FliL protein|uniref:flagellar basal body-associated protein FliL n=1 Tax=Idiomarina TaxID=135575 RepID=UPI000C4EE1C4|nr:MULTISPECIES: flagellar basal body-associated protein FliL [Idiomarina]MAA61243.1 flagellar basal body-associated protein FliL [Idiomarina sp.]MRJ44567.1 flagellar basal body-associated protein FliL [Idiomarina loihiensis]PWW40539.1 flagellar FliL protein [Idiomarina loihiensis]TDO48177.1 flagellar FliL protein [Idiomarina sp. 017G]TDP50230.1 flagellar FliL protein [Idiomarina loihiensis]|tara:strand:+ start:75814 stop:76212 length:399 start_codon:yes stop_codon:yes gene_type:complete
MKLLITVFASIFLWFSSVTVASADDVSYYGFEPDITTNYLKEGNDYRLGFIRVAIEVMVPDPSYVSVVEHHAPLLRNAFVSILSTATERQVRTMTGRDQLRLKCIERAKELMQQETGNPVIRDVLFTKYIYQ